MIHFPQPWLRLLEETSTLLNSTLGPIGNPNVAAMLPELEFRVHISLFAVRKVEESIGVDLHLASKHAKVSWWPVTPAERNKISRSTNPDLAAWYHLKTSQHDALSYKRIIDLFVHARICSFAFTQPMVSPLEDVGLFVASDHTMKDRILLVPAGVVDSILVHAIATFRPILAKRHAKQA
jgi:hypothetical protein